MSVTGGLDFGRRILEKYGWKEGKGLGMREDGIAKAIKPSVKLNRSGVGHEGELMELERSRWWECAYNEAAQAIAVVSSEEGIKVKKRHKNKPKNKYALPPGRMYDNVSYDSFIKTSCLFNGERKLIAEKSEHTQVKNETEPTPIPVLTDEEIFQACGKRTVHKGARHGLKLSGKLARIARQEEELFEKLQRDAAHQQSKKEDNLLDSPEKVLNDVSVDSCSKNKKKKKVKYPLDGDVPNNFPLDLEASSLQGDLKKKRKKKKRKEHLHSDFINETVVPTKEGEVKGHKRKKHFINVNDSVIKQGHELRKNYSGSMEYAASGHKGRTGEAEEHPPTKKKKKHTDKFTD